MDNLTIYNSTRAKSLVFNKMDSLSINFRFIAEINIYTTYDKLRKKYSSYEKLEIRALNETPTLKLDGVDIQGMQTQNKSFERCGTNPREMILRK